MTDWRVERACVNLDVAQEALPQMLCAAAGIASPATGTAARETMDTVLAWAAALPAGAVDAPHARPFSDALKISPSLVTPECRRAVAALHELVTGMDRTHLRDVATGLDIRIEDVEQALNRTRAPRESDASGQTAAPATTPPESWPPTVLRLLRRAVCTRLAAIGDTLLEFSEWQPRQPEWMPAADGAGYSAIAVVDGAPQPLLLTLTPSTYTSTAMFGRSTQIDGYAWTVGWHEDGGQDNKYWSGYAPTAAMARYQTLVMTASPEVNRLKERASQRLFRPHNPADTDTTERTLGSFLQATQIHRRNTGLNLPTTSWPARPHRTPDDPRHSALANLCWMAGLPWPDDPHAAPDDPQYTELLLTQGVRLDPATITYLTHIDDAGEQPVSWEDRHTAGMRAVIDTHDNPLLEFALHRARSITVPADQVLTLDQLDHVEHRCRELRHQESLAHQQQVRALAHRLARTVADGHDDHAAQLIERIELEGVVECWQVAITALRKLREQWLAIPQADTHTLWPPTDLRTGHRDSVQLLPRPQRPAVITAIDQWQTRPGYPDHGQWPSDPDRADCYATAALLAWMARRAQAAHISLPWPEVDLTGENGKML